MPLVSVVMPVFNREKFLAEAIESILAQTFTDFEFLVVDDGSQDRSAEITRSYAQCDERIRFFQLERNVGKAAAKNHAINAAKGEYIAGMDSDDVSLPERLEKQLRAMRANPEIGALGTGGMLTDEDLNPYFNWDVPEKQAQIAYDIFLGGDILCATLMIRRDVVKAVGGYELSRKRGNDIEWVSRLIARTRFANLPDHLYLYRKHGQELDWPHAGRDLAELQGRLLFRLWGETPPASLDRFARVRRLEKLTWRQRRLAKHDILRLIEAMIEAKWIEPDERQFLYAVANRQLEQTSPRLWQMFCHWRRHRFSALARPVHPR